jgi:uncharacterized protein (TIGR02246 family)
MHCSPPWASLLAVVVVSLPIVVAAQDNRQNAEQAIRSTAAAYRAALAKGDSKAVADFWTSDGYYVDDAGQVHPAGDLAAEIAQAPGPPSDAKVTASNVRFLTPDVALEDGASEVVSRDAADAPLRGHYHAVWVRHDGRWRLASLVEVPLASPAQSALAELAWMIGPWTAQRNGSTIELDARWNTTGTFLLRDIKVLRAGELTLAASQRIGWDPLARKLKSWSFDSDGGYSEATWTRDGNSWIGQTAGVLPGGRQSSSTTVIKFDGKNSFTRRSLAGRVDGRAVPDQEIRFTRRADRAN